MEKELEKFLGELKQDAPNFEEEKIIEQKEEEKQEEEEDISEKEPHKNRRHRRWESSLLEKEKELAIKEARIQALSEVKVNTSDIDPRLLTLYGDNENGRLAAKLTAELIADAARKAKEEAIQEVENKQQRAIAEQRQYDSMIDEKLEDLEDNFSIDLTSNAPAAKKARREFLEMVHKLSPKDKEGNLTSYADFDSVFEIYHMGKKQSEKTVSRSKEIADRSMQNSHSSSSKEEYDRTKSYLKSIGLNL